MSSSRRRSSHRIVEEEEDDDSSNEKMIVQEEDDSEDDDEKEHHRNANFGFSQQAPELSQALPAAKPSEREKLESLSSHQRDTLVTKLSQLVLFKALAGDTIHKRDCAKEAFVGALGSGAATTDTRFTNAVYEEVTQRLSDVFGFELRSAPKYMMSQKGGLSKIKLEQTLYLVNEVPDDAMGSHSKAIHSVHPQSSREKALLMMILSFCFCQGVPQRGSRWISDTALYKLLNGLDENIPDEPPETASTGRSNKLRFRDSTNTTPDVDILLEKFVHMDYLVKEKIQNESDETGSGGTRTSYQYAMGPRSAMEIGRKQIIYFCAEVLEEDPDPTMLAEIEESEEE